MLHAAPPDRRHQAAQRRVWQGPAGAGRAEFARYPGRLRRLPAAPSEILTISALAFRAAERGDAWEEWVRLALGAACPCFVARGLPITSSSSSDPLGASHHTNIEQSHPPARSKRSIRAGDAGTARPPIPTTISASARNISGRQLRPAERPSARRSSCIRATPNLAGLAASYDRLRRFDLADRAYAQAIRSSAPTPEILNNQGFSYMLRGDYGRARAQLSSRPRPRTRRVLTSRTI